MIVHRVYRSDPKTRIILLDHELNQFYLSRGLGTHQVWGGGRGHKMSLAGLEPVQGKVLFSDTPESAGDLQVLP